MMTSVQLFRSLFVLQLLGVFWHNCRSEWDDWYVPENPAAIEACVKKLTHNADSDSNAKSNREALCADLSFLRRIEAKTHTVGWTAAGKSILANLQACLHNQKASEALTRLFRRPKIASLDDNINLDIIGAIGDLLYAREFFDDDCAKKAAVETFTFSSNYNPLNQKILTENKAIVEKCICAEIRRSKVPTEHSTTTKPHSTMCTCESCDAKISATQAENAEMARMKGQVVDTLICVLNQSPKTEPNVGTPEIVESFIPAIVEVFTSQGLCEAEKAICPAETVQKDALCRNLLEHVKNQKPIAGQTKSTTTTKTVEQPTLLAAVTNFFNFASVLSEPTATTKVDVTAVHEVKSAATIASVGTGAALGALKSIGKGKPSSTSSQSLYSGANIPKPNAIQEKQAGIVGLFSKLLVGSTSQE